jgi:hypothetical protein
MPQHPFHKLVATGKLLDQQPMPAIRHTPQEPQCCCQAPKASGGVKILHIVHVKPNGPLMLHPFLTEVLKNR